MKFMRTLSLILPICLFLSGHIPIRAAQEQAETVAAHKFDEFGSITCEDELARLDAFAIELQNAPGARGHIIVYGGRRGRRNEAKARLARMKFYLARVRGLDARRIVTVDGGFRGELSGELWVVGPGEPAPAPGPTVNAKDVRLRGRVRVRGYNCGAGLG